MPCARISAAAPAASPAPSQPGGRSASGFAARFAAKKSPRSIASREILVLSPLPCWKHLSEEVRRQLVVEMIADIEAGRRSTAGTQGVRCWEPRRCAGSIRSIIPGSRRKSPAPLFHAVSKWVRLELWAGYAWFVAVFREASTKLRSGDRLARFPAGSFPPALPFVAG
jgi:hypothetical protein